MAERLIGKYRVLGELGQGGMADVFLVVMEGPVGSGFTKLHVVKTLKRNFLDDPSFVSMFLDEARLAARVNHPNVVQTNEIGEADGNYYIAMEYLDGQPLHRILSRASRLQSGLPPRHYMSVLVDTLAGLHHAHELRDYDGQLLNVVHRDATPQNVFVTYEGQVKVVDFGIAKASRRSVETKQGIVKGKVGYMAPEQLTSFTDRRADIFAVGVMLWEAVTGARMWGDEDHMQIMRKLISGDVPSSPKAAGHDVDDAIDAICRKALAVDPEQRYATALEFKKALDAYLSTVGGKVSSTELGEYTSELFVDKRRQVQALIEQQLSKLDHRSFDTVAFSESIGRTSASVTELSEAATPMTTESSISASRLTAPAPPPAGSKVPLYAAAAGVLLLVVGGGVFLSRRSAPATTLPESVPSATAPEPMGVDVTFTVSPSHAKLFVDGAGPFPPAHIARLTRGPGEHNFRAVADGYVEHSQVFVADRDRAISVALSPVNKAEASGKPTVASGPRWIPGPAKPSTSTATDPTTQPAAPKPAETSLSPTAIPPKHRPDETNPFAH